MKSSPVLFLLALTLLALCSNVYDLLRHLPAAHHRWYLGDYVGAALVVCVAVFFVRENKIRRGYPYAVAGGCLIGFASVIMIALHWSAADDMHTLRPAVVTLLDIAGEGLVLFEGMRWFRSIVKPEEKRAG